MTPTELLDQYWQAEADRVEHTARSEEHSAVKHRIIRDLHQKHGWTWAAIGEELGMSRQAAAYYAGRAT